MRSQPRPATTTPLADLSVSSDRTSSDYRFNADGSGTLVVTRKGATIIDVGWAADPPVEVDAAQVALSAAAHGRLAEARQRIEAERPGHLAEAQRIEAERPGEGGQA